MFYFPNRNTWYNLQSVCSSFLEGGQQKSIAYRAIHQNTKHKYCKLSIYHSRILNDIENSTKRKKIGNVTIWLRHLTGETTSLDIFIWRQTPAVWVFFASVELNQISGLPSDNLLCPPHSANMLFTVGTFEEQPPLLCPWLWWLFVPDISVVMYRKHIPCHSDQSCGLIRIILDLCYSQECGMYVSSKDRSATRHVNGDYFWQQKYTEIVNNGGRIARLILGLRLANERRRYFVTTSLIGWA